MIINWIIEHWQMISGFFVALFSFITGRKTARNAEKSGELQNLKATREVEKELFEDMKTNISRYNDLLKNSDDIISKHEKVIQNQEKKIQELETYIQNLKKEISSLKRMITNLKKKLS